MVALIAATFSTLKGAAIALAAVNMAALVSLFIILLVTRRAAKKKKNDVPHPPSAEPIDSTK